MKKLVVSVVIALAVVAIVAFAVPKGREAQPAASGKLSVVTSFYPLYYLASEIGGNKAVVTNITPAGAEPHDYEPTSRDMALLESSDIVVLNGGGLEAWASRIAQSVDPQKTRVIVAGDGFVGGDPHIWLAPLRAEKMAGKILAAFVEADPANEAYYRANADALAAKLSSLDADYAKSLSSCAKKDIVTSHAAFGYLAEAYGLNQEPIAGLSPDAEPSPRQIALIARFAKAHDVRYIFFESLVSPKLAETLATEIGAETLVLDPIEGLSSADLAAGKDYISEMRANLANLTIALQCTE